mmetsp:Transcript_70135/g.123628  ORF Transcript_70135/g.123628 Transcript_70135/m.123628 type:complete len:99 (-) Transcript_70135:47-343(-)
MSDLFSPGRNVMYFRCNTKEWVDAAIVGPSARGGSYIKLKYTRDGREFENGEAPRSAVRFVRSPSPPSRSPSPAPAASQRSCSPSVARSRSRSPSLTV